jgi:NADH-quinone oxidoreductase subunit K
MEFLAYQEITITHYMILSAIIFVIGVCGIFLNRKSLISLLMSLELILLAVNLNFISFSYFLQDLVGQIFVLFTLTIAAAEVAIGLAILIVFFRQKNTINIDDANIMKG